MATSKQPNVIILISDALRPKDLGLYGRKVSYDLCLQKIARECSVFMQNITASNGSDPSVTSLFSGQLPTTTGFIHQHPFMRSEEIDKLRKNQFWLPLYLQKRGYRTFSGTPLHLWFKKGFQTYADKESLKTGRFLDIPLIKRALLRLPNWAYRLGKRAVRVRASPEFYPCTQVISKAIDQMHTSSQPFFMFMHLVDTHYPYPIAPLTKIKGTQTIKEIIKDIPSREQQEYIKKRFFDIGADNFEQIEKKRDDSIRATDREIGRLVDFLKKTNLWENTLLFILSDHGDTFGEHATYFCRGGMYEPSIHVPLLVHIPGVKPRLVSRLTQTTDISATILGILKDNSYKLDGKSLLPLIISNKEIHKTALCVDAFCEKRMMIRTNSRKFVTSDLGRCFLCGAIHHKERKEVYDLISDPHETTNRYKDHKDMEKLLQKSL